MDIKKEPISPWPSRLSESFVSFPFLFIAIIHLCAFVRYIKERRKLLKLKIGTVFVCCWAVKCGIPAMVFIINNIFFKKRGGDIASTSSEIIPNMSWYHTTTINFESNTNTHTKKNVYKSYWGEKKFVTTISNTAKKKKVARCFSLSLCFSKLLFIS